MKELGHTENEARRHNMRLASCGVKCLNSSSVFQINFSAGLTVLFSEIRFFAKRQNVSRNFKKTTSMKKKLLLICLFFSFFSYSQSLKETAEWINNYTYGRHSVTKIKDGKIILTSRRFVEGWATIKDVQSIDPKIVDRIFFAVEEDGWGTIVIKFKNYYKIPTIHTVEYEGKATVHPNEKVEKTVNADRLLINLPSGKNTERIFNAYLHLFKLFNKDIKKGTVF